MSVLKEVLHPTAGLPLPAQLAEMRLKVDMIPQEEFLLLFDFFPPDDAEARKIYVLAAARGFEHIHVNLDCDCGENPAGPGFPHVIVGVHLESIEDLTEELINVGPALGFMARWSLSPWPPNRLLSLLDELPPGLEEKLSAMLGGDVRVRRVNPLERIFGSDGDSERIVQ